MKRRPRFIFIYFAVVYALSSYLPMAHAQNPEDITIGIAPWGSSSEYDRSIQGFKDALTEAGFIEGKNVKYILRNAETDFSRQVSFVESMVKEKVSLIYSLTTPGTLAAKSVTKDIPIVFSVVTYPVETGVIDSLVSSGNNLTGTRNYISAARQYFYFEKIFPHTKTLAFVHRKGEPNSAIQFNEFKEVLEKRKIHVVDIAAVDLEDMRRQLESVMGQVDSCYTACDTLIQTGGQDVVIQVSQKYRKPVFTCLRDGVEKGALVGDVADFYDLGKISGQKAVLILEGMQPAQILTESPQGDHIAVNMKTARELGLAVPEDLLKKAKETIQ